MKLNRPIVAIPLAHAALCVGCDAVFSLDEWDRCPSCADTHIVPLTQFVAAIPKEKEEGAAA